MYSILLITIWLMVFGPGCELMADSKLKLKSKKGLCITFTNFEAISPQKCKASTKSGCVKGLVPHPDIKGSYKIDADPEKGYLDWVETNMDCKTFIAEKDHEFDHAKIDSAGVALYSENIKPGDNAFIVGKSVNIRSRASLNSKVLYKLNNGDAVKIILKSGKYGLEGETAFQKGLLPAYWFQIKVPGKKLGWVYGQFICYRKH